MYLFYFRRRAAALEGQRALPAHHWLPTGAPGQLPQLRKRQSSTLSDMTAAPAAKKPFVEHEHVMTEQGTKHYTICGMRFETTAKYAVRKAVGQGAYGLVCSGRDVELDKPVAIKKIPKAFEDTTDCKRLLREVKILRHFKHANVLGIIDILPPLGGIDSWKDVVRHQPAVACTLFVRRRRRRACAERSR
jgi:hypothetical protein